MENLPVDVIKQIFNSCETGLIVMDKDFRIVAANSFAATVLGYTDHLTLIGIEAADLIDLPENTDLDVILTPEAFDNSSRKAVSVIRSDGTKTQVEFNMYRLHNDESFVVFYPRDSFILHNDALTNTLTREQFYHQVEMTKSTYTLFFVDLNDFKIINDTYGHRTGDEVLVTVAKRFKNVIREDDMICRYGGDEFIILVRNFDFDANYSIVAKLKKVATDPIRTKKALVQTGVSIGVASSMEALNIDDVIHLADKRMYNDKSTKLKAV